LERATRFWEPHVIEARRRGEVGGSVDPAQGAEWIARSLFTLATIPPVSFDASDPEKVARYAGRFIISGLGGK
jgi:hypothetical protein